MTDKPDPLAEAIARTEAGSATQAHIHTLLEIAKAHHAQYQGKDAVAGTPEGEVKAHKCPSPDAVTAQTTDTAHSASQPKAYSELLPEDFQRAKDWMRQWSTELVMMASHNDNFDIITIIGQALTRCASQPIPQEGVINDCEGILTVDTIANNLDFPKWHDEFIEFYKPSDWLNSRRAACAFLTNKIKALLAQAAQHTDTLQKKLDHEIDKAYSLANAVTEAAAVSETLRSDKAELVEALRKAKTEIYHLCSQADSEYRKPMDLPEGSAVRVAYEMADKLIAKHQEAVKS